MTIQDGDGIYGANTNLPALFPKGVAKSTIAPESGTKGYYQESIGTSQSLTTAQYSDGGAAGTVLGIGIYDMQAIGVFSPAETTRISEYKLGIGTVTGNSSTGIDATRNATRIVNSLAAPGGTVTIISTPIWRVTITEGTVTYYPKISATFDTSSLNGTGILNVRTV